MSPLYTILSGIAGFIIGYVVIGQWRIGCNQDKVGEDFKQVEEDMRRKEYEDVGKFWNIYE